MLACTELIAFERLAADASFAPTLDKAELAAMAGAEVRHYHALADGSPRWASTVDAMGRS